MENLLKISHSQAYAESEDFGTNLQYDLNTTTGKLTISVKEGETTGSMPTDWRDGDSPWYSNRSNITSVEIENGVTNIGNDAFYNCSNLESVTLPNSVTSIGNYAFESCPGLTSITMPNVNSIGDYVFNWCSRLETITMPKISSIGHTVFQGCTNLETITVGEEFINNIDPDAGYNSNKIHNNSFQGLTDRQITINVTDDINTKSHSDIIEAILSLKPTRDNGGSSKKNVVIKWIKEIQIKGDKVYPCFLSVNENQGIEPNNTEMQDFYSDDITKFKFTVKPGYKLKSVSVGDKKANILDIKDARFSDGVDYTVRFIMPTKDAEISFETEKVDPYNYIADKIKNLTSDKDEIQGNDISEVITNTAQKLKDEKETTSDKEIEKIIDKLPTESREGAKTKIDSAVSEFMGKLKDLIKVKNL